MLTAIEVYARGVVNTHTRRARCLGRTATLTLDQWLDVCAEYRDKCAYCNAEAESLDHVLPLVLGGGTDKYNVVPACLSCNLSRGRYLPYELKFRLGELRYQLAYSSSYSRELRDITVWSIAKWLRSHREYMKHLETPEHALANAVRGFKYFKYRLQVLLKNKSYNLSSSSRFLREEAYMPVAVRLQGDALLASYLRKVSSLALKYRPCRCFDMLPVERDSLPLPLEREKELEKERV